MGRLQFLKPSRQHLSNRRFDLFLAGFYSFPMTLWRIRHLVRSFQPDVLNVHFPDAQIPFVLALRESFDFRFVVSLHGHEVLRHFVFDPEERLGSLREDARVDALRAILTAADAVTACSNYLLEHAVMIDASVESKGQAIYNGIDLTRFENAPAYQHPRPYFLAYGRLTQKKGFDLLIKAFAELTDACRGYDLVIAGEGESGPDLERLVNDLGLENRVIFYGRASQPEVVSLLNGAEFVVVPSRREPFGIVALEAMAAGKLLLSTRVGGLPEFVKGEANQLVPPTVEGLAQGLRIFLNRYEKGSLDGKQNRLRAEGYSWDRCVHQYVSVYEHYT